MLLLFTVGLLIYVVVYRCVVDDYICVVVYRCVFLIYVVVYRCVVDLCCCLQVCY